MQFQKFNCDWCVDYTFQLDEVRYDLGRKVIEPKYLQNGNG